MQARDPRPRVAFVDLAVDDEPWPDRPRRYKRRRRSARTMSALLVMGLAGAAVGGVVVYNGDQPSPPASAPVALDAAIEARTPAVTRAERRVPPKPSASASRPASTPKPKPKVVRPVAGLNQAQMNNAAVIVQVAQKRGLPRRAMLVAMITGLQESRLRNLANPTVPASLDEKHEGTGENFDSLGVFQQRPSQGWGSVDELMDPRYAADAFYKRLLKVSDWESRTVGEAAQAVQRSAVPDAYDDHETRATKVLDALL
ncbi:hypothetical protein KOI35_40905 [Actinoplanes bogorensis]|uniref:Peptidase M23 n=1 Tax=Paractinoplanes bogorensis TaxID=1610840 RepID=A0ABS5Z2G9_9ACTN|nr:hypothetical protein [Actinoplanes bogorensis]MBU2669890.1 hypothetical protein [Actinoplanes bogorensis]